jgi:hypothetical protein
MSDRLRKETLLEMRRRRHAYAHEVVAVVDELLELRQRHDRGDSNIGIPQELTAFLTPEAAESRASWAKSYLSTIVGLAPGEKLQLRIGGHDYTVTKS